MKDKGKRRGRKASTGPTLFPVEEDADHIGEADAVPAIERWKTPRSWSWTTVGEVGEVKSGKSRSPRNRPGVNATKYIRAANGGARPD
jgi:hypothetical protein